MNRQGLLQLVGNKFPNGKGAEIGTFKGEFSKEIMKVYEGTLYMIDVWRPLGDEYLDSSNHALHSTAYSEAMENIKGHEDKAIMVRASSEVAAEMFADKSLDFVYIDANHAYDFVKQDIALWYPKVKKGGYVMGHDYLKIDWYNDPNFAPNGKDKFIYSEGFYHGVFGVNPAVDEFCKENKYKIDLTEEWFGTWSFKKR